MFLAITPACTCGGGKATAGGAVASASAAASASASTSARPGRPVVCHQDDTWPFEGHDVQRTSASGVCLDGPLRPLWHATATTPIKERPAAFSHVVVTDKDIIAVGVRGKSSVLHALELTGAPRWDYDSRHDMHGALWPMVVGPLVGMNDDPMCLFDLQSGKVVHNFGSDSWGQMAADAERLYWTNTWHIHGPPLHLLAASIADIAEGKVQWEQSRHGGATAMDIKDELGGVTLDGDSVFQVASYQYTAMAGLAALTASTGQERWRRPTKPVGFVSAGAGRLYLVERGAERERRLVARSQSDGAEVWSLAVDGALGASPLVASGLVVVDTKPSVVVAVDEASGQPRWRFDLNVERTTQVGHETSLAAAANDTLVVTAGKEIVLLTLSTGEVRWRGPLTERPLHSPVLAGGRLYAVAGGEIWVFEGARTF